MTSPVITINGVDRTSKVFFPDQAGQVSGSIMVGQRSSAQFKIYSTDGVGGWRPQIDDTYVITVGPQNILAGVIDDVEEDPLTGLDTGFVITVTVSDWYGYLDGVSYTVTYPAGTFLGDALDNLAAGPLAPLGITIDPLQDAGPAFAADVTFKNATVQEILARFTLLTGRIPRISAAKELIMFVPAVVPCGFTLSDATTGTLGTVSTKKSRNASFANFVILTAGPSGVFPKLKTWVQAGGATSWVVDIPAAAGYGPPGLVYVDDGVTPFDATVSTGPGAQFQWDQATGTLSVGTLGTPANGVELTVSYWAQFPFVVEYDAGDPPDKRRELRISNESIVDFDEAVATAAAYGRVNSTLPLQVTVRESAGYAFPGLYVPLSFAERGVLGNFLISAVDFETADDGSMEYTLTCLEGTEAIATWLDFYAMPGGGGSSISGAVVSTPATVISSPVHMGGSDRTFIAKNPAAWVRVPNAVPFVPTASFTARLRAMQAVQHGAAAITVKARIYDDTASAPVFGLETAPSAFSAPTEATATGNLVGGHRYFLEMLCNTNGEGVAVVGIVESV